jgi:hypothetical protein
MEEIRIGGFDDMEMPPEPPQKRASELEGYVDNRAKRNTKSGFADLKQPERKKAKPKKEDVIEVVTPEQAQAEASRPSIDRISAEREGKISRKVPRGIARPL